MPTFDVPGARIRSFSVGSLDNNVYVVTCTSTNQAVIVDAAADADAILAAVVDLDPVAVLTTHGHHDHIGAAGTVTRTLGIPFRLHEDDRTIANRVIDDPIEPGSIMVGELEITIRHTPGHTPGSVCFVIGSVVLTGDTLFPGGPGATRFPYSDFDEIMRSLRDRLFDLPDETGVWPGHGTPTTIGEQRPFLAEWQERRW